MKKIMRGYYTGERALFGAHDLTIEDTIFADGESPLKESADIDLRSSMFKWKYPLWYADRIHVRDCTWFETARAGVWYTDHITVEDSQIEGRKISGGAATLFCGTSLSRTPRKRCGAAPGFLWTR